MAHDAGARFIELKAQGRLPSIKGVALSILEASSNEDVSLGRIAQIITPDPALTARLIKISNSALYPGTRPAASLQDAIAKLGMSQVRQIALGFALVSENREGACAEFDYPGFWARSIIRGSLMRQACVAMRLGSAEEMFTLGLLARIGELALATAYPEKFGAMLEEGFEGQARLARERELFGMDSASMSAALMEDWKLPAAFAQAALVESAGSSAQAPARIHGLAALTEGCERVSQAWLDLSQAPKQERLEALGEPVAAALAASMRFGGWSQPAPSGEAAKDLAREAFEEADGWLESLAILPKLAGARRRGPAKARSKAAPALAEDGARPLKEALMEPRPVGVELRALVGSSDPGSIKALAQALAMRGGQLRALRNREELFDEMMEFAPHALFLDFEQGERFAGMLSAIKATAAGSELVVVAIGRADQEQKMAPLLGEGVDGFVCRPFSVAQATAQVAMAEKMAAVVARLRESKEGLRRYALEMERANQKMRQGELADALTGLPKRQLFADRLTRAVEAAKESGSVVAVAALDLKHADAALRKAAQALRAALPLEDSLARLGESRFAMALRSVDSVAGAERRARAALAQALGPAAAAATTLGLAAHPADSLGPQELIDGACRALDRARKSGAKLGRDASAPSTPEREAALGAFRAGEWSLSFEPRVDLRSGALRGARAALAWKASGGAGEEELWGWIHGAGLGAQAARWAASEAMRACARMRQLEPSFEMALALPGERLRDPTLAPWLGPELAAQGCPGAALWIESPEPSEAGEAFEAALAMQEAGKLGIGLAVSGFGGGYSSLGYLAKLPFSTLVVGRAFVSGAPRDRGSKAVAQAAAALAAGLGRGVGADGVDSAELADFARSLGASWGQGGLFGSPGSLGELEALAARRWVFDQED